MMNKTKALALLFIAAILTSPVYPREFEKKEMGNGIKILHRENSSPISSFTFLIKLGVFDEESYAPGIRDFFAWLIKHRAMEAEDSSGLLIIEKMGAAINTQAEPDVLYISGVCRTSDFESLLELITAGIANPVKNKEFYNKTKKEFIKRHTPLNGIIDNVYTLFLKEFYKYHSYKQINQYSLLAVERTDSEKMKEFVNKTLSSDKIIFAYTSSAGEDKVNKILAKHLGHLVKKENNRTDIQWEAEKDEKQLFLTSLSKTGWLAIGFPFPSYSSTDYPAMLCAKNIIGSGFASRMWEELRENRGLAYELGAITNKLEGPAHLMFYIVIQPKNMMKTRKYAMQIIEELKENGVTQSEVDTARQKITGEYLLERESGKGSTYNAALAEMVGGGYTSDEVFLKRLKEVTPEDVVKTCRKYLDKPMILIIRPPGLYINDTYY